MLPKKIGAALTHIHKIIQTRANVHIVHTSEISREERELLLKNRWLQEIIKGWYLVVRPDQQEGDSSAWYANFWDFLVLYLQFHYGDNYCLSAEHSIDLALGNYTVPRQVIVLAEAGSGSPLELPFDTSLLIYKDPKRLPKERVRVRRLETMALPFALCKVSPTYFQTSAVEAQIALQSISDSHLLSRVLIENEFHRAAGRIVGAYRHLGNRKMAEEIKRDVTAFGLKVIESDPFEKKHIVLGGVKTKSSHALRVIACWESMREDVLKSFPKNIKRVKKSNYLKTVAELYIQDAYHSLSIEGYQVSKELIEKVIKNKWNPLSNAQDKAESNALAARGYYESFEEVQRSLKKVLKIKQGGEIVENDLALWFQKLFAPMVRCGIIKASDLLGYRKHQVYIRGSRHTPFPPENLREVMESFFECLQKEKEVAVSAVLGHFLFEYIHPYMDGNGRIGRFLMNVMFAADCYPWTIITVEHRKTYLAALESASVEGDIRPLTKFIADQMRSKRSHIVP